jgi:hypothetical protein
MAYRLKAKSIPHNCHKNKELAERSMGKISHDESIISININAIEKENSISNAIAFSQ